MSGEFSTLILKVDLSCCECNKKIKKLLCKIQDRENIRLIAYDEKNNTVTISGPFDPPCLKRKLYRKACKIIKDINTPPPPPAKKPDPPPAKKPDPPPAKKPDPPPEKKPDPPVCCTRPCYVGMFGGMKCASCGMVYTWTNQDRPPVMVYNQPPVPRPHCYDGYGYGYGYGCGCGCGQSKTCNQFICEYNTSQCTIM